MKQSTGTSILRASALAAALVSAFAAQAQEPGAASKAAASASSPTERMQRDAASPLYWIKVLSDKPAAKPAAAAPKPVVAAAPAPSARPAVAAAPARPSRATAPAVDPSTAASSTTAPSTSVAATSPAALPGLDPQPGESTTPAAPGSDPTAAPAVGVAAGGMAAPALAASPGLTAAEPPVVEEPDPGLVLVSAVDPEFPPSVMTKFRKGVVTVRFEVSPDGQVSDATVQKTTHRSLDSAALAAVKQWRFKPAPIGHTASVELAFDLDK